MKDKINTFKEIKDELTKATTRFSSQQREEKVFDKWSLKDVVAHLSNWMIHDTDCLKALKKGKEPYWEPDVDEFNKKGVESRKNRAWDEVYKEFIDLGNELINLYETLPGELREKQIWEGKNQTARRFLQEDIEHWRDEHLIEVIHYGLADEDWISPNTEIKQSGIGGKGLFTTKPIKKDEVVVVWGGTYVASEEAEKAKQEGKLVMQWDGNLYSVEDRGEGTGYFVNHSCEPNLWMKGAYALVAMRDVKEGEELTADYALWEADEGYVSKWECGCGSQSCRKRITGKDWQLPELQERYKDHFSPLINKRIRGLIKKAYSSGGLVVKKRW
jgi:hypothetical protein